MRARIKVWWFKREEGPDRKGFAVSHLSYKEWEQHPTPRPGMCKGPEAGTREASYMRDGLHSPPSFRAANLEDLSLVPQQFTAWATQLWAQRG